MRALVAAPMRIDWAGGWTDVPRYADEYGGAVANSALTLCVRVECAMTGDGRIRLHAEDADQHMALSSPAEIRYDGTLDLHKAALNMLPVLGGIEILSRSDAPAGAGLGGSGALDVALLAGLARCRQESFDAAELAEMAFMLEAGELGLTGGRQDQYAAALGGAHLYGFAAQGVSARRLELSDAHIADLEAHVILAYTGRSHFSSQTHDRVWQRFEAGDRDVTDALAGLHALAAEAAQALEAGDWQRLAQVVNENWRRQQQLDVTIATPRTREMDEAVRAAGAWGVKATGAGAGGCLVALAPTESHEAVVTAFRRLGATVLDARFAAEGVEVKFERDDDDVG